MRLEAQATDLPADCGLLVWESDSETPEFWIGPPDAVSPTDSVNLLEMLSDAIPVDELPLRDTAFLRIPVDGGYVNITLAHFLEASASMLHQTDGRVHTRRNDSQLRDLLTLVQAIQEAAFKP
ncbi:hypothetical protein [Mycobacterium stomatepiae]|uniref:hypothetical protein n=1 Tax=Mycobacterium stomatepiae TaxID=470076 RepID=UPI0013D867B6|nr:hypothetical protein [Mycobacterium stomatepiae]MCV7167439.1 hypothetical protein [Mycobacterium stomatepiae]